MNQGRIWCVVSPTVGLPLFLGSVAVTSLIVHASIMTHTTWMNTYWMGKAARAPEVGSLDLPNSTASATQAGPGFAMTVTPTPASGAAPASFVITVTPTAKVVTAVNATAAPKTAPGPIHTASAN